MRINVRPSFHFSSGTSISFENTIAVEDGGGLCVYGRENTIFTSSSTNYFTFRNSRAQRGGGIYYRGPGSVDIQLGDTMPAS